MDGLARALNQGYDRTQDDIISVSADFKPGDLAFARALLLHGYITVNLQDLEEKYKMEDEEEESGGEELGG
ncbi:hypothetical protein STEG23_000907, partial [Scotinomys teguina]